MADALKDPILGEIAGQALDTEQQLNIEANLKMEAEIARRVQQRLNSGESAKRALQEGFDSVQEVAKTARERDLAALSTDGLPQQDIPKWKQVLHKIFG